MSAALLLADSGPLIALARLELHDLPARYFESVFLTATVWEEVTRKPQLDEVGRVSLAADAKLIQVVPDTLRVDVEHERRLQVRPQHLVRGRLFGKFMVSPGSPGRALISNCGSPLRRRRGSLQCRSSHR